MKKLFFILVVLIASSTYAQKEEAVLPSERYRVNAADSIKGDTINKTLTLHGNVDFESGKLRIEANELFLDQKTNSLVATGLKDINFDGTVVFKKDSKHQVLKYTIGDDTVFIE